jgi:hypothetical protein
MNFNNKFMERFFRPVDEVVWDMMSGKVGFKTKDGICSIDLGVVVDTEAPDAQVSVNPFEDFGMAVPAFAQSVPVDSITLGDMIYSSSSNKVLGWVVKKNDKSFKLMKQDGTRSDWVPPKVQMIGFDSGVMVLRSLMNMLPGGASGLGQMQSMLMPMMAMGMMGDGDSGAMDMKSMMPMMLMSQMGMGGAAAPVGGGMASMMPMMMMMQMMKGDGKPGSKKSFFGE